MSSYANSDEFVLSVALAAGLTSLALMSPAITATHQIPTLGATISAVATSIGAYLTPPVIVSVLGFAVVVPAVIFAGYKAICAWWGA